MLKLFFLEIYANGGCNSSCNYVSKNKLKKRSLNYSFIHFSKIKTFVIDKLKWANNFFNKKKLTRLQFFRLNLTQSVNPIKHYKIRLSFEFTEKACMFGVSLATKA